MDASDRRRHRRFTLNVPASVHLAPAGDQVSGTLYDLSEGGAFFTARLSVEAGAPACVSFQIRGALAEAVGEVARTCPFGAQLGIGVDVRVGNDTFIDFLAELARAHEGERPNLLSDIRDLVLRLGE